MNGYIDNVTDGVLHGWISRGPEHDQILRLHVYINDIHVFDVDADGERPDVVDARLAGGRCGFVIRISDQFRRGFPCRVALREASTNFELPNSPVVLDALPNLIAHHVSLEELAPAVQDAVDAITDPAALAERIPLLSAWFGRAVDRAAALHNFKDESLRDIRASLQAPGALGGALGHLIGLIQSNYPPIIIPTSSAPVVSVIIPVHNKFNLTYDCIRSISEHLPRNAFEIIIVDDLSSDETLLSSTVFYGGVRLVRNGRNMGFVGTCNYGAEHARGEFLFFLNNDTLLHDGWLDELVETFRNSENIGIAGSKLLFGDGKLQECGGIIWRDGSGWNWGRGGDPDHPKYCYMRDVDYVSGAALMVKKEVFGSLGGFDVHYAPAYYEDTDLCFKVRQLGQRVVVQPASVVTHLEGQSNGTHVGAGLKRFQVVNSRKFVSRWRDVLRNHRPNAELPDLECERAVGKRALFVDDSVPTPDQDAGSNAAWQHMRSLQRLGYKVTFLPADNVANIPPYTQNLQKAGIECWYAPHVWSLEDYLRRVASQIDLIYLHRYSNASRYMDLSRKYVPQSKILYNVADLHGLREMRGAGLSPVGRNRKNFDSLLNRELDLVASADVTVVHSSFERDFISEKRPHANVHVVPWSFTSRRAGPAFAERSGVAFVGGYGHPPNVDAVNWFVKEVLPLLKRVDTDLKFYIVGSKMPESFRNFGDPAIVPVGFVADLDDFLATIRLTVAPLRYGAGLKGKVLTSFSQGVPCIMTSIASEGIAFPDTLAQLVTDSPEGMADKIMHFYSDSGAWQRAASDGLDFCENQYSESVVDRLIGASLSSCSIPRIEQARGARG